MTAVAAEAVPLKIECGMPAVRSWAPVARHVSGELQVLALVRHAGDDEPEAGPVVELLVHQAQFRRVVVDEHRGEGGVKAAAAGVQFLML